MEKGTGNNSVHVNLSGMTPEERISHLMKVAYYADWGGAHRKQTFTNNYYVTRLKATARIIVWARLGEDSSVRIAEGKLVRGETQDGHVFHLKIESNDVGAVERVLREIVIDGYGLSEAEKDLYRPLYPEPPCYSSITLEMGYVPKRIVNADWIRWRWVNGYRDDPIQVALQRILNAEFAIHDHANKECTSTDPYSGEDVEIKIYHVTRERV